MKKMITQARQGDVYIINKTDSNISADTKARLFTKVGKELAKDQGRIILAYGEVTGHAHAIKDEGVQLFTLKDTGNMLLTVKGEASLGHDEHSTIAIPQGENVVIHQKEYQQGQLQRVVD
jgi:hypothetical protein